MSRLTKTVFSILILICILLFSGCISDTGFDKRATLMPDSIGVSIGQQHFEKEDAPWGITFNMQWDLK